MKLSVVIADEKAGQSAFVVWRGFSKSIPKAAKLGFHGVELALREKEDVDIYEMRKLLQANGLEVSSISTGQVFADLNLYLTDSDCSRRRKAEDKLKGIIELASEFGRIVNLGRVRGFIDDHQTQEEAEALFIDSLTNLNSFASKLGVQLVVEPVNRYETNFINSVEQCAELLNKYSLTNVGIMPDTFHMNIEDALIGKTLEKYSSLIKYVHVADSNRHSPGSGHLDFDDVFNSLMNVQYNGWVSVEVLPVPDPDTAAQRSAAFLLPFIDRANEKM